MFGGRFSLTRFNLAGTTTDILIRIAFADQLEGQAGAGSDIRVESMTLSARLEGTGAGAAGIPLVLQVAEGLKAQAGGVAAILIAGGLEGWLEADCAVGADYSVLLRLSDSLAGKGTAGANIHFSLPLAEKLEGAAAAGADLYDVVSLQALLSSFADAGSLEELVTIILGSIPPGSELRIDSDNFTVTLDGENVLYMQEGDWIDLERQLRGLVINAAGSLEGEVIYTERYL